MAQQRAKASRESTQASSPRPVVETLLVAEDDPELAALLARRLQPLARRVLEASDGEEALRLVEQHRPELLVLDVMMPGRSGWEVCREVRSRPELAHVGIVMLTGIGPRLNEMTSPLYGADAYLDKPFDWDELERALRRVAEQRRARARAAGAPGSAEATAAPSSGASDPGADGP